MQGEATEAAPVHAGLRLNSPGFIGLVTTQFLGAMNDNMFRWLAAYVAAVLLEKDPSFASKDALASAVAIGSFAFLLPFVIFATPAGFLGDRFSKRNVIVGTKIAEIFIMILGSISLYSENVYLMLGVVFLMGTQSTLFGPAKMGAIPEMLGESKLSAANGITNLATMVSIIVGTIAGFSLFVNTQTNGYWLPAVALLTVSVTGYLASLFIPHLAPADENRKIPLNPFAETWRDLRILRGNVALLRVTLAIAFFWTLACLAQTDINTYAKENLQIDPSTNGTQIGLLLVALAFGVSIGSVLAGWWSQGRIEMGLVPIACFGIAVNAMLLFTSSHSYEWTMVWLFLMGVAGGMYDVPLTAYLQHNSPAEGRGAVFAVSNFLNFSGMLSISAVFYLLHVKLALSSPMIFLLAGICALLVSVYMLRTVPNETIRFIVWLVSHLGYRVRVHGLENLPKEGGALLVCNHVSWLDGVLLAAYAPRPIRLVAYDENLKHWPVNWISNLFRTIPINASHGPKALVRSLQTASQSLRDGELVCLFAEGAITRTGQLLPFQRGLIRIVDGTGAPVVPVYLDELWGSIFSFSGGRFFLKWPRRWLYPVTIMYGKQIFEPKSAHQVRQAVQDLGVDAIETRKARMLALPRQFLRRCKRSLRRPKVADSTGLQLTGGQLLTRTLVLTRLLSRVIGAEEKMVGVLLPPTVGGVLVNTALPLMRRIPVNLNYTISANDLQTHLAETGIKHVITSRSFMEKVKLPLETEFVYLEDFKTKASPFDKLISATLAYLCPSLILERLFHLTSIKPDDLLTIIFTSGSTGEPKGVMLSYNNVASNIEAIDHLFDLTKKDVLLGVLPFFHSFGFTGTLWAVLALDPKGVYHFNPLDARVVGKLAEDHGVTILMATPTFLRSYIKRCDKEQFAKLELAVTGAEKLPADLAAAFQEKFGLAPSEGYGTTELSPLASVNVPDHRSATFTQTGTKQGSVGRPVPGVTARIVDPDTWEPLDVDQPGMLLIKGPNVMQGYLNRPEKTAEVVRDGWYVTGDIAKIDADGFIQITDRQSRFSKIGGEMVPHLKIEELLTKILAEPEDEGPELRAVVTAVADPKKGERLIVLHRTVSKTPNEICKELSLCGIPNLWMPSEDSFLEVEEIPVLGTGKLDLKGIRELAKERFSAG